MIILTYKSLTPQKTEGESILSSSHAVREGVMVFKVIIEEYKMQTDIWDQFGEFE